MDFTEEGLTGRKRYRIEKRCLRKSVIILQVEAKGFRTENLGYCVEVEGSTLWRDAKVEDLSLIGSEP